MNEEFSGKEPQDDESNDELSLEERLKRASFQGNVDIYFPEIEDEEFEKRVNNDIMDRFRDRIAAEGAAETEPGDDNETSAPATGN